MVGPEIATSIAAAMLPEKEYEKAFFTDAPRRVLDHLLRRKPHVRDLLRWMSDPEEIAAIVKGTPLAAYLDPGAAGGDTFEHEHGGRQPGAAAPVCRP